MQRAVDLHMYVHVQRIKCEEVFETALILDQLIVNCTRAYFEPRLALGFVARNILSVHCGISQLSLAVRVRGCQPECGGGL